MLVIRQMVDADWSKVCEKEKMFNLRKVIYVWGLTKEVKRLKEFEYHTEEEVEWI